MHCSCNTKKGAWDCSCNCHKCYVHGCDSRIAWQIEIQGFFKQFMCDRHTDLFKRAVHPDYLLGIEELS